MVTIENKKRCSPSIMQTMHKLMKMLSEASVNYTETTFDDKEDLEQLVHPYVSHLAVHDSIIGKISVVQLSGFPTEDLCVCNGLVFCKTPPL